MITEQNGHLRPSSIDSSVAITARPDAKEKRIFPTPATFKEYYAQLLEGRDDPRNPADRALRALTDPARNRVEQSPNGPIYHVFDERSDRLSVFGMNEAKRGLIEALSLSAQTGGADSIIMLVLPSGAGKSTLLEIVKKEVIRDARENPLLTIEGCPTRETPDHLLTDDERLDLKKKTGRVVHGELCADCQKKLDEDHKGNRDDISIKPVKLAENNGISELDPRLTKPGDWTTQDYILGAIKRASGGVLFIPEFVQQGEVIHKGMNDFYRGVPERKIADHHDGSIYRMECLVIGGTTVQEFEAFLDPERDYVDDESILPLKERILPVKASHNLSKKDEVRIYGKLLESGHLLDKVHVSPKLLEYLAEIAIQTRLIESVEFPVLTRDAKVDYYEGKPVAGFERNVANTAKLLEESREKKEGMTGISPQFIKGKVLEPLFIGALRASGDGSSACVTPLDAFKVIEDSIINAAFELGYNDDEYLDIVENIKGKYERWLSDTVIGAFNKRHQEAIMLGFEDYVNNVDRLLNGDDTKPDALDTVHEPLKEAEARAIAVEKVIFGHEPKDGESEEFRKSLNREVGSLISKRLKKGSPGYADGYTFDIKYVRQR